MARDDVAGLIGLGLPIATKPDASERRGINNIRKDAKMSIMKLGDRVKYTTKALEDGVAKKGQRSGTIVNEPPDDLIWVCWDGNKTANCYDESFICLLSGWTPR